MIFFPEVKLDSEVASLARLHIKAINEILARGGDVKPAFDTFVNTLRSNLNEAITEADAVEMISQHLITRPVFEALFSSYSFVRNNPVSKAIEAMLASLDSGGGLLKGSDKLDRFYESVRKKAAAVKSREGKQKMVLELYDKFFRLAFKDVTEKLGIVYTPVEAVDFIIRAVNDALKKHFGRTLADRGVHIIDPFTGTGTFITRLLQSGLIGADALEYKYKHEIHANEIVLLAYYIAAINIEETYHSLSGADEYTPFEGIVLTDTFQLAETQGTLIDINEKNYLEENSSRLIKQKQAPIKVIIGNPPYSVGQKSANDDNKNTRYPKLEQAIADTYVKHSSASNKNSLYDSYVKAFRWATDRLDDDGVICFITNGGYIDGNAFSGFRKCIGDDFSHIYCFNLKGNIRKFNKDEGENIFGNASMTGIAIMLLIRDKTHKGSADIYYHGIPNGLKTKEKLEYLNGAALGTLDWERVTPDKNNDWINKRNDEFETYIPLGDKKNRGGGIGCLFGIYSGGIKTNRDAWLFNFSKSKLKRNIVNMINNYNSELREYELNPKYKPTNDETKIKWSGTLTNQFQRKKYIVYNGHLVTKSIYRPFMKQYLYYDKMLIERTYQMPKLFPTPRHKNLLICINGIGGTKEFMPIMSDIIVDLGILNATQCFPLYYYEIYDTDNPLERMAEGVDDEGYKREYAVTDWALSEYRKRYGGGVTKEDIFYYIYGILHNREYRERFSNDLKKTLARIPFVKTAEDFMSYARAGRALAEIHLNYETIEPYPLDEEIKPDADYRVLKMRFSKDKRELRYNDDILFKNIPPRAFEYVINGRSPLEWVVDRYQITRDKSSGLTNDPNDYSEDDAKYIYNLVKRAITVSLKTLDTLDRMVGL